MIEIPDGLLGRETDFGTVTVTNEMIANYARAVGDEECEAGRLAEVPATFCLMLRPGMTPEIALPPNLFGVYGGHEIEVHRPMRVGESYSVSARVTDVYEKSGRSGSLVVVVRESVIRDRRGDPVIRTIERQIIRERPESAP